ncbi:MAG: DUF1553 domain-containing protein [Acidobacteriia bacterium]|nr:DUF1553 domain-containing protein [Terriglobia bacterium]
MNTSARKAVVVSTLAASGWMGSSIVWSQAQEENADGKPLGVVHAECALFGPKGEQYRASGLDAESRRRHRLTEITEQVLAMSASSKTSGRRDVVPGASRTDLFQQLDQMGAIDGHLFRAMQDAGATPAATADDYTFARRVSLDLTGRVPTYARLVQLINDPAPGKRARYIDELLNTSEWVDKWTMFFGDLFKNTENNTQVRKYNEGRNAFHLYIKNSLAAGKPYNVMATEMISSTGTNSWEQGEVNWNVGGIVTGGPRTGQDIFDQQAANVAESFLGISHENCILCHDGRRHLDTLSLWGKQETRLESYQLASFFSKTAIQRVPVAGPGNRAYYRAVNNNAANYPLNTTTGNRPPRAPIGAISNVAPEYPFYNGGTPNPGEPYRNALARLLTSDIQFSRAAVNYIWREFFGRGLVEPANQFDLDRLDADNPPPEPWTIQPTNPRLLNALARDFIEAGFDLKALMRQITNSQAYQLSSAYEGAWNPEWETLFARKFVRRLWAEEIADSIVQISNLPQPYVVAGLTGINFAMQLPDTKNVPGGNMLSFLDSFLRGNRIEEDRRSDGSVPQVLNLMNDAFVHNRTRASGTGSATSLARQLLNKYTTAANDSALIAEMFLTVLSRNPTEAELSVARSSLATGTNTALRQQRTEDLLWSLYNKVDFIYEK